MSQMTKRVLIVTCLSIVLVASAFIFLSSDRVRSPYSSWKDPLSDLSQISETEQNQLQEILVSATFNGSVNDEGRSKFINLLKKVGKYDDASLEAIRLRMLALQKLQTLYWNDALYSFKSGVATKSSERQTHADNLVRAGMITAETMAMYDGKIREIP